MTQPLAQQPQLPASPMNVAVLMFDNVEVLDFAGPFEVFGVSGGRDNKRLYDVFTVAQHSKPVLARNNMSINCDYTFETMPLMVAVSLMTGGGSPG